MTKQEQIEEMVDVMTASNNPFIDIPTEQMTKVAEALYDAGFRKIFMSDILDAHKALKAGYDKGYNDGFDNAYSQGQRDGYDKGFENARSTVRNETAKEFAEKLKEKAFAQDPFNSWAGDPTYVVFEKDIDELLKEYEK